MLFDDFVNAHGRARSNTDQREMEGAVGVVGVVTASEKRNT